MKQISLRLPDALLAQIDEARGQVPRDRWLREAAKGALSSTARFDPDGPWRDWPVWPGSIAVHGRILRFLLAEIGGDEAQERLEELDEMNKDLELEIPEARAPPSIRYAEAADEVKPFPKDLGEPGAKSIDKQIDELLTERKRLMRTT